MRILASDSTHTYVQMEDARDIEDYIVRSTEEHPQGFEFFRGLGILGYSKTFKMWLRKFPRPIFLAALKGREIVSWVFVEEAPDRARDGLPIFILRAIETLPPLRRLRLGYRLLLLSAAQVSGYLTVKPLTVQAYRFFERAGFVDLESLPRPPAPGARMPGYMVLPPQKRMDLVDRLPSHFTTMVRP